MGVRYGFGDDFRAKLSGNYHQTTIHESNLSTQIGTAVNFHNRLLGEINTYGPIVNLLNDMIVDWLQVYEVQVPSYPALFISQGHYHLLSKDPYQPKLRNILQRNTSLRRLAARKYIDRN